VFEKLRVLFRFLTSDISSVNLLECEGNYGAASNNMKLVELYWPAVDGWAVTFGTARRALSGAAARALLALPNVTAHTSTASK